MTKEISKVKIKITVIFSIIVFSLILFLGLIFFTTKYFKTINLEKNNFENIVYSIKNWKIQLSDILRVWNFRYENQNLVRKMEWRNMKDFHIPNFFMNYLYLNHENEVLFFNFIDDIDISLLNKIIWNESYLDSTIKQNNFLIRSIQFNDNSKIILLKKSNYGFNIYINEIFWFLIISFLFSFLIYFLWIKFTNNIFIPVEENIKDMNDFIHNAGHEFKTPLSVIDSNTQLILEKKEFDIDMIYEIKSETLKLNSLIDSLINLTNIDSYKEKTNINLVDILDEIIKSYKIKIKDKNLTIVKNIDKDFYINANKDYLYIFLSNIIWNSIKYNKINWNIFINYLNNTLEITDTWIWIKESDLSKIWDRFYKTDNSRNSDWFWIWLSIVKKISDIYWWNISIKSEINNWTSFIINTKK